MRIIHVYGCTLLMAITVMYCLLIWYGVWVLAPSLTESTLPLLSRLFLAPLPLPPLLSVIHFQGLACLSLVGCLWHGVGETNEWGEKTDSTLPYILHLGWILFALCCHFLGVLAFALAGGNLTG